jgi:O-antigen/teichoic acid export membrane protein
VNADYAMHGAPVLPIITVMVMFTVAGQSNSGAILVGQGRHRLYSYGLTAEVVMFIGAMVFAIPRYGIVGAAWAMLAVLSLTRGLLPAYLLCRFNGFSFPQYMTSIYGLPVVVAVPVFAMAWLLRSTYLPGRGWQELFAAAVSIAATYYGLGLFTYLSPEHRSRLFQLGARVFRICRQA